MIRRYQQLAHDLPVIILPLCGVICLLLGTGWYWVLGAGSIVPDTIPPTVIRESPAALTQGPGGPILLVTTSANPFTGYVAEILRAEGLNAFATADIATVSAAILAAYDVVILGEMPLTAAQVSLLTTWVTGGGNLLALRPDKQLAGLLGLSDAGGTLANAYLRIQTESGPGVGLVSQTIQFHGPADRYTLTGATSVATLYTSASTATTNPAVTLRSCGDDRRPRGGLHLRPRPLGGLHPPGESGLGRAGAGRGRDQCH